MQINGQSIVSNGVANVPVGSQSTYGVYKLPSPTQIKNGNASACVINTSNQHEAVFHGLAKSAGDVSQKASSNAVGQYTDEAKVAIQKMLGLYKAPYRLIKTIEITEETGTITIIADDNGNAFALTDVIVYFDGMKANGTSNGSVALNNDALADRPFITIANLYDTTAQRRHAELSVDGGRFIGHSTASKLPNEYTSISLQQNKNACGIIQHDIIDTLIISSLNLHKFTSGTITIYGR